MRVRSPKTGGREPGRRRGRRRRARSEDVTPERHHCHRGLHHRKWHLRIADRSAKVHWLGERQFAGLGRVGSVQYGEWFGLSLIRENIFLVLKLPI